MLAVNRTCLGDYKAVLPNQLERQLIRNDARIAVSDVGEGASMDKHRLSLESLCKGMLGWGHDRREVPHTEMHDADSAPFHGRSFEQPACHLSE